MKPTDAVINNRICEARCKKLAGREWRELFNETWIQLHKAQEEGKQIEKPIQYFCAIAFQITAAKYREKKPILTEKPIENTIHITQEKDIDLPHINFKAIETYLNSETIDEVHQYYKNLLELILEAGSIAEGLRASGLTRMSYYSSVKELKQILKEHRLKTDI